MRTFHLLIYTFHLCGRSFGEECLKIDDTFDGSLYCDICFNSPFLILNMIQRSEDSLALLGWVLENMITIFGILNFNTVLEYFEEIALPSLICSKTV